ncbi:hypothetical protein BUE80_DR013264 [Diplocarpon rosae]|nr:hypothetical protein BUE80_DR013264 [Diplocarpon rosae]
MIHPIILLICVAAQVLVGAEARAVAKEKFWPAAAAPQTCVFAPHAPPHYPTSPSSIPSSAWPLIRSLLTTHLLPAVGEEGQSMSAQEVPLIARDSVRTLYLRDYTPNSSACASTAAELDPLVLGLVFTASPSPPLSPAPGASADRELRRRRGEGEPGREREARPDASPRSRPCIEQAVLAVERDRRMEGILDLPGGKVAFLVWRTD